MPDRVARFRNGMSALPPENGHAAPRSASPISAKLGSRHDTTSKFELVERSILLA
jgi:hypothetical protein